MADPVAKSWSRIQNWLIHNADVVAENLQPGATDEEIAALETKLGVPMPDDLRASLEVHNGAEETGIFPTSDANGHSLTGFHPLSAQHIASRVDPLERT